MHGVVVFISCQNVAVESAFSETLKRKNFFLLMYEWEQHCATRAFSLSLVKRTKDSVWMTYSTSSFVRNFLNMHVFAQEVSKLQTRLEAPHPCGQKLCILYLGAAFNLPMNKEDVCGSGCCDQVRALWSRQSLF